eukprot:gene3196-20514_t
MSTILPVVLSVTWVANSAVYNVQDFGVVGDGITVNTEAIAKVFAACNERSAIETMSTVVFPSPGIYVTSSWEIACNNTIVVIETGATVASVNTTLDWPLGMDCPEPSQGLTSHQAAPFVLLNYAANVTITGGGVLDAKGPMWWEQHCGNWWCPPWVTNSSAANPYAFRPFMLRIASSRNVHVDNITFKDPGFWCVVPTHSNYVSVKNVVIDANGGGESPNTDGSSNVMVEDLHCKGSHGITVGSVWYDNVVNVTYRRVVMEDCAHGNATISNITFEDIFLHSGIGIGCAIEMDYETPGSKAKNIGCIANNIVYKNITGSAKETAGALSCLASRQCTGLHVSGVHIEGASKGYKGWECSNVIMEEVDDTSPTPDLDAIKVATIDECCAACQGTAVRGDFEGRCAAFTYMPSPDGVHTVNCWLHATGYSKPAKQINRIAGVLTS